MLPGMEAKQPFSDQDWQAIWVWFDLGEVKWLERHY
jgi:hypothetical protein